MRDRSGHFHFGLFLLILASAGLYLLGNNRVALWDRDEPRYAMASRWMLASGDWVVPRMGWGMHPQTPRTAKPPFIYWCQASAMKWLGPTVSAARLPSSLAMILTLILLACVIGKYFPRHVFWMLLVFASSVLTIIAAKMCVIDSVQLLWITICQLCLYALWRGNSSLRITLFFGIALGLAGLSKGPVAWGVLATTLIALRLLRPKNKTQFEPPRHRDTEAPPPRVGLRASVPLWLHSLFSPKYYLVPLIAILIPLPWLVLVHQRSPGFLSQIFGHDLLQRMHEPLEGHKGPPGFYLLTIFGTFYPWSLFLPLVFTNAWRHRDEPAIRFALAAVIGPWIMFECISTKMVHYVLPIFPPLAFLLADALLRQVRFAPTDTRPDGRTEGIFPLSLADLSHVPGHISPSPCTPGEGRGEGILPCPSPPCPFSLLSQGQGNSALNLVPRWAISIWAIATTAVATALILPDRWFLQTPLWPALIMVLAGLIYAIVVLNFFWKANLRAGVVSMGLGFIFLAALLFAFYLPAASFLRISPEIADILNRNHITDARMIGYEEQSLAFYDKGRVDSLSAQTLHKNRSAWPPCLIISRDIYQRLPASVQNHLIIIGRATGINYSKSIKPVEVLVTRTLP